MIKAHVDNDGVKIEASGYIIEITKDIADIITALHGSIPEDIRPEFREVFRRLANATDSPLWEELPNDQ